MKQRITLLNIFSTALLQIISTISGFIVPRLILSSFGSSINGLVSSLGQILSYISLVEGGITGVIIANLYKPLIEDNKDQISSILVTAKSFYNKIAIILTAYSLVIAFIYPLVVNTGFSHLYVVILTLVLALGTLSEYLFSLTLRTLLTADKKVYIISFTKIGITLGNLFLTLAVTKLYPDIILLKVCSTILYILQPIIFNSYIKKHYEINWKAQKNNSLIKERWNGFAINFAAFIHSCTDITILTFFFDLKTVSVYTIYYLIISKMEILIHSIASGIEPTVGQAYARNNLNELNQKIDMFEFIIFTLVGILFAIAGLLITPFVLIYTSGITDTNYNRPLLGTLLLIAEALYLVRYPHVSLAYSANKFKEITIPAYIEAAINIATSLLLIKPLGVVGVAVGTIAGMLYRNCFQVYYTSTIIPNRKQFIFYKKFLTTIFVSTIGILIGTYLIPIKSLTISNWIVHGFIYTGIFLLLYVAASLILYKKEINVILNYLKGRK